MRAAIYIFLALLQVGCASDGYYYQEGKKISLTPNNEISRSTDGSGMDYYTNERGTLLGVSEKIIVKLKNGVTIDSILSKYGLSLEKELGTDLYLLKADDRSKTIDTANRLSEDENIKYAQPDFSKKRFKR